MAWEEAFEDLRGFVPMSRPWFAEGQAAELALLEDECERLIVLGGRFAAALPSGMDAELRRRAGALEAETAPGTAYDMARRTAIAEFIVPQHCGELGAGLEVPWGLFGAVAIPAMYGFEYANKLLMSKGKLAVLLDPQRAVEVRSEVAEAGREWLRALTGLSERLEAQKYWGSALLIESLAATGPNGSYGARYDLQRELVPQFHDAYRAVLAAATDLARCHRARRCGEPASSPAIGLNPPKWFVPSEDFTSVRWGEELFSFTLHQAAGVKMLWDAFLQGMPDVKRRHLLHMCRSDGRSVADVFRVRKHGVTTPHPAWNRMIVCGERRGLYRLVPPPGVQSNPDPTVPT